MTARRQLAPEKCSPEALEATAQLHPSVVDEVERAVEKDHVVVVGMAQNPFVKKARRALVQADIAHTYLEYGSYLSGWKARLAIKLWAGFPTFPMVFVDGTLIGGARETVASVEAGRLK